MSVTLDTDRQCGTDEEPLCDRSAERREEGVPEYRLGCGGRAADRKNVTYFQFAIVEA